MPSREQTVADAVSLFEGTLYPEGLRVETAWLGIYQVLLWYEEVGWAGYRSLPHIAEADRLRPPASRRQKGGEKATAWQKRAAAAESYLAKLPGLSFWTMGCESGGSGHPVQCPRKA